MLFFRSAKLAAVVVLLLAAASAAADEEPSQIDGAATAQAAGSTVPIRVLIQEGQRTVAPDGLVEIYISRSRVQKSTLPELGRAMRVNRSQRWIDIEDSGGYALTTDAYLGSEDYLDPDASYIKWSHSTPNGNLNVTLTKNASLNGVACPTDWFGRIVFVQLGYSELRCYAPNSSLSLALGYGGWGNTWDAGPAIYRSEVGSADNVRTYEYEVRAGTVEKVGGDGLKTVISSTLAERLKVKLVDAEGLPVSMPISGNTTSFTASIQAPRHAAGMRVEFFGTSYPDSDATSELRFTAGNVAGIYTVTVKHPDADNEVAFSINVVERDEPEDDEENEEENGEDPCASVGDPILLSTGNVWEVETDYARTGLSPIEFVRTYNSQGSKSRLTGTLWSTTYDRFVILGAAGEPVRVRRPDGRTIRFSQVGSVYQAQPHFRGSLLKTASGWRYVDEDQTVEEFDSQGRLLTITDLRGRITTATFDRKGVFTGVSSNAGGALKFAYNSYGQLETVTDHANRTWTYTYDAWSNLRSVKDPDGVTRDYRYEDLARPYNLTSARVGAMVYGAWEYDTSGRGIASYAQDVVGSTAHLNRIDIEYLSDGSRVVVDANNNVTTYGVTRANGRGFVSSVTGPGFASCGLADSEREFDAAMNVTADTSFGRRIEYGDFDASGQYGFKIEAAGTLDARRTEYVYDPRFIGKPTRITEPSVASGQSKITEIDYNAQGNVTRLSIRGFRPDGSAVSRTTVFEYNGPFGQVSRIDGPRTDTTDVVTLTYDTTSLRLKAVTNANGIATRSNITYTPSGQVKSETRPNGVSVIYAYVPGSDLLESITETGGGITRKTSWTYTSRRQVQSISFSDGVTADQVTNFTYNAAGDLTVMSTPTGSSVSFTRDAAGNIRTETSKASGATRRWIEQTFDAYHRVDQLIGANNIVDVEHHPDGTLTKVIDGRTQTTDYEYDDFKRLTRVLQPGSVETTFGYDVADRLIRVTDANQGITRYGFDDLGNRVRVESPDTGISTFTHDATGNLLTAHDAKGQLSSFTYDPGNRLKTVDRAGLEYDETYSYDTCSNGAGRLCRIVNGLGEQVDFEYDALGRISKVSNNGVSVGYAYNAPGNVTRITYPSGRAAVYDYNTAGQVTAVKLDRNGTITTLASNVVHQPFGPVMSWTYGNGLTHSRSYDQQYWPRSISTPTVSVLGLSSYNGNGNLTSMAIDGSDQQFGYDTQDRLETANGSFGSRIYGYDGVGNRTSLVADGTSISYGYDPQSNRLASETGWIYQRDANGNTEEKRSTDGLSRGFRYTYSPHNRLTAVYDLQAPLTPLGSYRYNGLGQRSSKLANGRSTRFAYGLSPLLLAEIESGAVVQEYVYLNGMPLALLGAATVGSAPPSFDEVKDNGSATGDWVLKSYNGAVGGSYLLIEQKTQQAADSHEWSWNVPVAGTYQLQVLWVPPNNAGISQQVYRLNTSTVTVSGAGVSRGGWAIGPTITLPAGPATLTLSEALNGSQKLFADAARLVLIQVTLPAPDFQYVHTDHLGTPHAVTDKNKQVVWRASYDPFGTATVNNDPDADGVGVALNLRFAGQYFDVESALHYNYFRDYDPSTGRYIQSDPIRLAGGMNTFGYSGANPIAFSDLFGLERIGIHSNASPTSGSPLDGHGWIAVYSDDGALIETWGAWQDGHRLLSGELGSNDLHRNIEANNNYEPTESFFIDMNDAQTARFREFANSNWDFGPYRSNCAAWVEQAFETTFPGSTMSTTDVRAGFATTPRALASQLNQWRVVHHPSNSLSMPYVIP